MADGFAVIVLSGGKATRLDGRDKASLVVDGTSLLERVLTATALATETIIVGDATVTSRAVTWTREEPVGGGPAAGLYAGLDALVGRAELVSVIAVDMPRVTADTLTRLIRSLGSTDDGAVLVDAGGQLQPLCAVYRAAALQRVRPAVTQNRSMKSLLDSLTIKQVESLPDEARDIDTQDDLDREL